MQVRVDCYAGYRGDETPRRLTMGARHITVVAVQDRWLAPDHRYFKIIGDDGGLYLIRHDPHQDTWQLTFFKAKTTIGRKMFKINIGSITEQGLEINERLDAAASPMLDTLSRQGDVCFSGPVHLHLRANLAGESVLMAGTVATEARIPCSRCLKPFNTKIETEFSATAIPAIPSTHDGDTAEEVELRADEMDVIAYCGDSIDLGDEIAQQVIMALPFKPLCRDTCKGLCSRCGTDLNITPCDCSSQDKGNPFDVLKNLSFPKTND